jgi:hypothetical protein
MRSLQLTRLHPGPWYSTYIQILVLDIDVPCQRGTNDPALDSPLYYTISTRLWRSIALGCGARVANYPKDRVQMQAPLL